LDILLIKLHVLLADLPLKHVDQLVYQLDFIQLIVLVLPVLMGQENVLILQTQLHVLLDIIY